MGVLVNMLKFLKIVPFPTSLKQLSAMYRIPERDKELVMTPSLFYFLPGFETRISSLLRIMMQGAAIRHGTSSLWNSSAAGLWAWVPFISSTPTRECVVHFTYHVVKTWIEKVISQLVFCITSSSCAQRELNCTVIHLLSPAGFFTNDLPMEVFFFLIEVESLSTLLLQSLGSASFKTCPEWQNWNIWIICTAKFLKEWTQCSQLVRNNITIFIIRDFPGQRVKSG